MLTYPQLTDIITNRRFTALLGQTETNLFEAKASPYQLGQDKDKSELAKDVSALANHEGGYLIMGLRTVEEPTSRADKITELRPFGQQHLDRTQYRQVLDEWIYPPLDNLTVKWVAIEENGNQGLGIITVPPQPGEKKPFLITKTVLDTGKRRDILVGYAQRKHDQVETLAVEHIHQLIRDGMSYESLVSKRFDELDARLAILTEDTLVRRSALIELADVTERINHQAEDAGLTDKLYIALAAYADPALELQTLFTSREGSLGMLIENPPSLRQSGFDIRVPVDSQIIDGTFRRSLYIGEIIGGRVLVLYRDSLLIFIAEHRHFCWAMENYALNATSLIETVYNFYVFFQHVLNDSATPPDRVTLCARIHQPTESQRFFLVGGQPPLYRHFGAHSGQTDALCTDLDVRLPATEFDPAVAALKLLEEIYIRFGLEADAVPYVEEVDGVRQVNKEAILNLR